MEQPLLVAALQLMLYGMGIVFVFLAALVLAVRLMTLVLAGRSPQPPAGGAPATPASPPPAIIAAIAAVAAQRARKRSDSGAPP